MSVQAAGSDHAELRHDSDSSPHLHSARTQPFDVSMPNIESAHKTSREPFTNYCTRFLHWTNPLRWISTPPVPEDRTTSPEYGAGLLSRITFQWIYPLLAAGYKRDLNRKDIWIISPDTNTGLLAKLVSSLERHKASGKVRPLLWALFDTFKLEIMVVGLCEFLSTLLQCFTPLVLRQFIRFVAKLHDSKHNSQPPPNLGEGFGLVVGMALMQFLQFLLAIHVLYCRRVTSSRAKSLLIALIFDKVMKLSESAKIGGKSDFRTTHDVNTNRTQMRLWYESILNRGNGADTKERNNMNSNRKGWSDRRIFTLATLDTRCVNQASIIHQLWSAPLTLVLAATLIIVNLSYSGLAGLGAIVIFMLPLLKSIRIQGQRSKSVFEFRKNRISLIREAMRVLGFIKYLNWEKFFLNRIQTARDHEMQCLGSLRAYSNFVSTMVYTLPTFASIFSFISYSLSGNTLHSSVVFSSFLLFNLMRNPLRSLPEIFDLLRSANQSFSHIEQFLSAEEQETPTSLSDKGEELVCLQDAGFTWERRCLNDEESSMLEKTTPKQPSKDLPKQTLVQGDLSPVQGQMSTSQIGAPFTIESFDLSIKRSELIGVTGNFGSGKSSLLAALAGNMRKISGNISVSSPPAISLQQAWIWNSSVRENITFGGQFESNWYSDVIKACALELDIARLPNGDFTEVGERGVVLSGGQKQRISLARAVYSRANIVILDDPLSSLDVHVGRHILDNAICGLLKAKCRIVATHQTDILSRCDRIIWIEKGKVQGIGSFQELKTTYRPFCELVATSGTSQKGNVSEIMKAEEKGDRNTSSPRREHLETAEIIEDGGKRSNHSFHTWMEYIKTGGGLRAGLLLSLLVFLSQGTSIAAGLWLSFWISNKFGYRTGVYIGVYITLGTVQGVLIFTTVMAIYRFGTRASKRIFDRAISRIFRAPLSFINTTPFAHIMDRFSRDMYIMEIQLTENLRSFSTDVAMITSILILVCAYYPLYSIALGPLFLIFTWLSIFYRRPMLHLGSHEAVFWRDIFARFNEGVAGVLTIRAYHLQGQLSRSIRGALNDMDSVSCLLFASQAWLSVRLLAISLVLLFSTGCLILTVLSIDSSIAGLILLHMLGIPPLIQRVVKSHSNVVNDMDSVERLHQYGCQIEQEASLHATQLRSTWPESGKVVFRNVKMRYHDGLPLVLKGLSIRVNAGEHLGLVGRTGAGKSSIVSALLRLQEIAEGTIFIDGVDISKIGIDDLRSKLAVVPQAPTLFRGTIRSNLDPLNEYSDQDLLRSLQRVHLIVPSYGADGEAEPVHLGSHVEEEGLNYSFGQRQLICLARALIRNSKITIFDEATSSIDLETDEKIQKTIAGSFTNRTLLCIAHRLRSVIKFDRICVIDAGLVVEEGTPLNLYHQKGIFRSMCDDSGIKLEGSILRARQAREEFQQ